MGEQAVCGLLQAWSRAAAQRETDEHQHQPENRTGHRQTSDASEHLTGQLAGQQQLEERQHGETS